MDLIRRTKQVVKEVDNIHYRRMKKVFTGNEEQLDTVSTLHQSTEYLHAPRNKSHHASSEILVGSRFPSKGLNEHIPLSRMIPPWMTTMMMIRKVLIICQQVRVIIQRRAERVMTIA